MKGKRHTTEQKIRILREADGGIAETPKSSFNRGHAPHPDSARHHP